MVAKKAKSKRMSCRQKYKIRANVSEHKRKERKEAKKNPQRKQLKKDPGIPNLYPFKEKLLNQVEAQKEAKKQQELENRARNKAFSESTKMAELLADANARSDQFNDHQENHYSSTSIETQESGLKKDDSRKAFYREFNKVVESADVILQILDVRDPLGCRSTQIEEMILQAAGNKRIILVLNKIDLVPREIVEQWLKYLRNFFPTIAFKASTQTQRTNLSRAKISVKHASKDQLNTSECLGADTLMKLLKNYCRNQNIKTSITVGVVGFPNVGKSSVINSLKRARVCNVGSTPGITKSSQEIALDKYVKLIDSPGIVFSKPKGGEESAESILRNCVKVELLEDPIKPVDLILSRCKKEQLMIMYNIPYYQSTTDFLVHIAKQRGRIRKGGIPDIENAARSILQDWNAGRIHYFTAPPTDIPTDVASTLVSTWSEEFAMPEVVEVEGRQVLKGVKGRDEISYKMLKVRSGVCAEGLDMGEDEDESMDEGEEEESDDEEMDE